MGTDYRQRYNDDNPVRVPLSRKTGDYLSKLAEAAGTSRKQLLEELIWKSSAEATERIMAERTEKLREVAG